MKPLHWIALLYAIAAPLVSQHRVWRVDAPAAGPLTSQVAIVGDRDGDGHSDFVRPVWTPIPQYGSALWPHAWTFSGRTGQVLTIGPFAAYNPVTGGDINGDGHGDYIMAAYPGPTCPYPQCSGFEARNGMNDSILWHVDLPTLNSIGTMALGGLDLDGDARPDALIGTNQEGNGHLFAINSQGNVLYHLVAQPGEWFGPGLAKFIDYDQDGRDDFLLGMYVAPNGAVDIRSGADGSILRRLHGPQAIVAYGATAAMIGDLDGDSIPDVVMEDSSIGTPGVIAVVGSVSGIVLRQWQVNATGGDDFGYPSIACIDVDRDGFDDVIANSRSSVGLKGQFVFSGRDGTLIERYSELDSYLMRHVVDLPPSSTDAFPQWLAFGAYSSTTRQYLFSGAPQGVERSGAGSRGTLATMPILGLRELQPSGFRVTLSGAEPGAFAILVLGFSQPTPPYFDLGLLGFTNSHLYPQPDVLGFFQAGSSWPEAGYVKHDFTRSLVAANTPGAITAYLQWVVFGSVGTWPGGVSEAMRLHVL